jgi:hypothetical protein
VTDMLTAFEQWLAENNNTLVIPLIVVARAPGSIRLTFAGIIEALEVLAVDGEIVVTVTHDDLCWDILVEFGCQPMLVTGGVVCGQCGPPDRTLYPSYQALFVGHVFQPFAEWIESSLMPARALGLGGSNESGSTWAGLLPGDQAKDYHIIVPLRG